MCKIFVKPSGIKAMPKMKDIVNAWNGNSDGVGISYSHIDGEKANFIKGFMSFYDFMDTYMGLPFHSRPDEYTVVIHFRLATNGDVNEVNTHPFPAKSLSFASLKGEDSVVLSHNGIFSNTISLITKSQLEKGFSDTMAFTENVIAKLDDYDSLEGKIGYNKVVLLFGKGQYKIINSSLGEIDKDGIWHSNKY